MNDMLIFVTGLTTGGAIVAYFIAFRRQRDARPKVFTSTKLAETHAKDQKKWFDKHIRPIFIFGHTLAAVSVLLLYVTLTS